MAVSGFARKRFLAGIAAFAAPLGAGVICKASDSYTLRFNTADAVTSVDGTVALRFAGAVQRRTNGQLKIEVYPNGQLAKEAEGIDGLASGVIDLAVQAATYLEPRVPRWQVLDLPFLFKDLAAAHRVLDGPIGAEFFADLETKGILGLGWGDNGFKEMETGRAVSVPEDIKGQRMRVQNSAIYVETYHALGAIPVTIDPSEVFTALTQHTVDGTDVSLDNFRNMKWYTIVKHVAMTNHFFGANPILGSKRKLDALPAPLQKIVREEARAAVLYWRSLTAPKVAEATAFLKDNGVAFTEVNHELFRKAMEPIYASWQTRLGSDLVERVIRAAGA
jgi:tripartite ATP-independent transporter DctP family solute receptor